MKLIILSAFNGRLRSEPIEWADNALEIRMPISIANGKCYLGKQVSGYKPIEKYGIFTAQDLFEIHYGKSCQVFELTNI